jgi:hypothetical protein
MPRGSLPGERRGGREKGTLNKRTQEQIAAVVSSGISPLEYLVGVMRDESVDPAIRLDAAAKAAPYVHPRLAATTIDLSPRPSRPLVEMTDEELIERIRESDEALGRMGALPA